jgi:hypothetical protein
MSVEQSYHPSLQVLHDQISFEKLTYLNSSVPEKIHYPEIYLGRGSDSIVFKIGQWAVKVYCRPYFAKRTNCLVYLYDYQSVTNTLAVLTSKRNEIIQLRGAEYTVLVNPIVAIEKSETYGCLATVVPFAEGNKVDDVRIVEGVNELVNSWENQVGVYGMKVLSLNMKHEDGNLNNIIITDLAVSPTHLIKTSRFTPNPQ